MIRKLIPDRIWNNLGMGEDLLVTCAPNKCTLKMNYLIKQLQTEGEILERLLY